MKRILGIALVLIIVLTSVVSSGLVNAQEPSVLRVSIMGQDDLATLDPNMVEDVNGAIVTRLMFPGLRILNETTAASEPGIATEYTVEETDAGAVFTFNIIPEISWVRYNAETGAVEQVLDADGNPRFVTAADFVYAWNRTLDPRTAAPYGALLAKWVVNGEKMLNESAVRDADGNVTGVDEAIFAEAQANLGITAVDEYTLQITAPASYSFVPTIFGLWMASPTPAWAIEASGDAWIEPENINTYGPYALKEWKHDESITFIKNPFWAGTETMPVPQIDEIVNMILEQPAALDAWEAGELDYITPVDAASLDRVRSEHPDQLTISPGSCSYNVQFNMEKAPFDNVHARRAFSLAIDRQAIVDNITRGGQIPAAFFTLASVNAAPQSANYPEVATLLAPSEERIAAAQAEWQMYLDEVGGEVPPVAYYTNDSSTHTPIAEAMLQMWKDILGVEVELQLVEFPTLLDLKENDHPTMARHGWCFDYPDANNWTYDVYRSDSGYSADGGNQPHFANETFDSLVKQAQGEGDLAARTDLYGQAEIILVWEEAAIAPLYYYTTQLLRQEGIEGPYTNIQLESFEKWTINQ